jgi:hypothetical protein
MYCILLTPCIDNSHFAISNGFAKSHTSIVLQEYFQNYSVISKQQMPTLTNAAIFFYNEWIRLYCCIYRQDLQDLLDFFLYFVSG